MISRVCLHSLHSTTYLHIYISTYLRSITPHIIRLMSAGKLTWSLSQGTGPSRHSASAHTTPSPTPGASSSSNIYYLCSSTIHIIQLYYLSIIIYYLLGIIQLYYLSSSSIIYYLAILSIDQLYYVISISSLPYPHLK